jgi:hypothetical protein
MKEGWNIGDGLKRLFVQGVQYVDSETTEVYGSAQKL